MVSFPDAGHRQSLPLKSHLMLLLNRNASTNWSRRCSIWNSRWSFKKNFIDQNYREVGAFFMNDTSSAFQIIHDCLARAGNRLSVKELCSLAGVSRSGF